MYHQAVLFHDVDCFVVEAQEPFSDPPGRSPCRREEAGFEGDFVADFARHEGRFRSQFSGEGQPSELLLAQKEDRVVANARRVYRLGDFGPDASVLAPVLFDAIREDRSVRGVVLNLAGIRAPSAIGWEFRRKLEEIPEEQRWLVTSEGAFSYLCHDFGLRQLYLWPINADAQGTPQQVRKVIDAVRSNGIPVVFSESTVSDKPARQVAKETGARYGGVLYVDSLTGPEGPAPNYLKLLEANADTILKGFTGDK